MTILKELRLGEKMPLEDRQKWLQVEVHGYRKVIDDLMEIVKLQKERIESLEQSVNMLFHFADESFHAREELEASGLIS